MIIKNELLQSNQQILNTLQTIQSSCEETVKKSVRVKYSYEITESKARHAQKSSEFRDYVQKEKSAMARDSLQSRTSGHTRVMLRYSLGIQKLIEWKQNWCLTSGEADAILTMCDKNYIS